MTYSHECVSLKEKRACHRGLRIKVIGSISNVGPVPKVGCTRGISGIMSVGNTGGIVPASNIGGIVLAGNIDAFLRSGWFCLMPASLLTLWDVPLTASLKAG